MVFILVSTYLNNKKGQKNVFISKKIIDYY
jgi:hypothetical protein